VLFWVSFLSFNTSVRYLLNFFFGTGGIFGMVKLFRENPGGRVWRNRFFRGQILFWSLVFLQILHNWMAACNLLIGSFIALQIINRVNNWTEHAFIDPERHFEPLGNTYTIINSCSNLGIGGNEGYHGTHHLNPGLPNHLYPKCFRNNIDKYCQSDHLIFQKTSTFKIFIMLMRKDYCSLAKHYVNLPGRYRSKDEIIDLLRQRVKTFKT